MATVTVCGTASREVQPDFVIISLGLTTVETDAPSAIDVVAERSNELSGVLSALGLQRQDWITEGVNVAEEFEWRKDTQVSVGYRATTGVAVTMRNLDKVGGLLRDAVGSCHATVRNLVWRVDKDNPAHHELLADAALDARRRAEAYTAALGIGLGTVEVISEEPLREGGSRSDDLFATASLRLHKVADAGPAMDVSGGLVELSASVYIRFGTVSQR